MRTSASAVLIATTLMGAAATAGQLPGMPPRATRSGLIVGQVVDAASGRPLGGAIVDIGVASGDLDVSTRSAPHARIMTGADGRFVFRRLSRGNFLITAVKPGYAEGAYGRRRPGGASQTVSLADGQKAGGIRIHLWKPAAISGIVIDEAGEPVVGIRMHAMLRTTTGGRRRFVYAGAPGWTDDRGVYRIHTLLPGDYIVAAVATQISVPTSLTQELRQSGVASTQIAELGASVTAGSASGIQVGDSIVTLGRSAIGPAPAADDRLWVYPTTFHPNAATQPRATVVPVGSGEDRSGIDVHIRPISTRRLSGTVASADGQIGGIPVRLVIEDGEDAAIDLGVASTVTSRTGTFAFPAVPIGHYSIRAIKGLPAGTELTTSQTIIHTGSGGVFSTADSTTLRRALDMGFPQTRWANAPVTVGRDDISGVTVTLQPGLRIAGHVELEGAGPKPARQRVPQIQVVVEPATGGFVTSSWPARLEFNGRFNAFGLPGGKYYVRVGGAPPGWSFKSITYNGRDVSDSPLDLESTDATGVVVTFSDRPTQVSGTVRTSSGAGDPDATVLVFPSDIQSWSTRALNPQRFRRTRVSPAGAFTVSPLPPGDYYIVAVPDELSSDWQDVAFLDALSRDASQVSLAEGDKKTQDLRSREPR